MNTNNNTKLVRKIVTKRLRRVCEEPSEQVQKIQAGSFTTEIEQQECL